jgi:hypothetical protein
VEGHGVDGGEVVVVHVDARVLVHVPQAHRRVACMCVGGTRRANSQRRRVSAGESAQESQRRRVSAGESAQESQRRRVSAGESAKESQRRRVSAGESAQDPSPSPSCRPTRTLRTSPRPKTVRTSPSSCARSLFAETGRRRSGRGPWGGGFRVEG